jgi:DNA-directed RNA polymerase subunit RPC12/RpoP
MIIKCQECNHEIEGIDCPECGESTPRESVYCINCGKRLKEDTVDVIEEDDSFYLDDRILCSDGTCTGIIIDGKCSECGKPPEAEA